MRSAPHSPRFSIPTEPAILTTTVGSYATIEWLLGTSSQQAVLDAISVVIQTQRRAGIDLPTDGELYRFDPNHPETNGMIEYFISRIGGISTKIGFTERQHFMQKQEMGFRRKPAGVVTGPVSAGSLDLPEACRRSMSVSNGPLKFTLTSPYMLARTLLDNHYRDFEQLTMAIAAVLADQVEHLPCACVQIDEANIAGSPENGALAAQAINLILDRVQGQKAVHFCFGNYGGQVIQKGSWRTLIEFLNSLKCDHLVLEVAHRPEEDLKALKDIDPKIKLGIGVIDIKVNHIETADEVAQRIEKAARVVGSERIGWVHPDCGFWMLKRLIVDRKIEALVAGRDLFLGIK